VKSYPGNVQGEVNNFSDSSSFEFLDIRLISFSFTSLINSLCKILFLSSSQNLIILLNVKLPSSLSSISFSINSEYLMISFALI